MNARLTLEPLDAEEHAGLLHAWVTHPRSEFWQMLHATPAQVAEEYQRITDAPHHHAFLGRADGVPAFLVETYDPRHSELSGLPELRAGDLGMHVLVAPVELTAGRAVPGFTRRVMARVLEHCFATPGVRRVVVEPDTRNRPIAVLNAAAGFRVLRQIDLGHKVAELSVCSLADWEASDLGRGTAADPAAHLAPDHLAAAQRHLLAKAVSEFSHERLLTPEPTEKGWRLDSPDGRSSYTFRAQLLALEHWVLEEATLERHHDGAPAPLDVQAFVVEHAESLGIPVALLPTYLEELASTLASAMWKQAHQHGSVAELADAEHQQVEAAMSEGHPGFVANNGRIGFGLDDYAAFAPETGSDIRLVWVAARRDRTTLSLSAGLTEDALYDGELDPETLAGFRERLRALGLDPASYLLLPLHPWQWQHRTTITFAPDLARRDLVWLGEAPDRYRAQQSIRTFFNVDRPERHYVKTALAIQNMGFLRGLSPAYMVPTPAINDWVHDLVAGDAELAACGFSVLRERAAIGYTGDVFHQTDTSSAHRKMLAALWRESPMPRLAQGERLATMAALLHRDQDGAALATELVRRSGLSAATWLHRYLHAYLRPLVHCLAAHDLAFMPHGENLVMVLRDHVPVRMLMKDIGEEVAVLGDQPLPPEVERIRARVSDDERALAIHTDVFDGFFRHLAAIWHGDEVLPQQEFWAEVRACLLAHAADHPELAGPLARLDLLRASFAHSCLNRLQLRNTLQMVDLTDQASSLLYAGQLANPVADR